MNASPDKEQAAEGGRCPGASPGKAAQGALDPEQALAELGGASSIKH